MTSESHFSKIIATAYEVILAEWIKTQLSSPISRKDLLKESDLVEQSTSFLAVFREALEHGEVSSIDGPEWARVRGILSEISRSRAKLGFTPEETATFIFSLKQPIFNSLRTEVGSDLDLLFSEIWVTTTLLDKLGLFTSTIFQKSREEIIRRQQRDMLELSTPVVKLWDGILGLPMIGTLDSQRSQIVMENLLQRIVETGADVAIIDITGVPTVDTLTAQHLLKTISAARLMGADCIISGIRPQIAQTIVHLGIDLQKVQTKATMAEAFAIALKHRGLGVRAIERTMKES